MLFNTQAQEEASVAEKTTTAVTPSIIVYNDDYNTFDWVIKCFMEILRHSEQQAEQLSIIIHFKGKAGVKSGSLQELLPLKDALLERGLSAVIEKVASEG